MVFTRPLARPLAQRLPKAVTQPEGVGAWWTSGALLSADYLNGRFRYNGALYADETAFNTAIGATKSGIVRTLAPKVLGAGAELVTNGAFTSDVSGWSANGSGDITFSSVASKMQMVRGAGSIAGRPTQGVLVGGPSRALRIQATPSGNGVTMSVGNNGGASILANTNLGSSGQQTVYGGSGAASPSGQVNLDFWPTGTSQTASVDDVSVKEVGPLAEHSYAGSAFILSGTTPATASGNKVLLQADCDNERDRVRVVYDGTGHLHVITTVNNTQQADLDMGAVATNTAFVLKVSVAQDAVRASLDGNGIVVDSSAAHPGMAYLRIGRSFTGETWDGTISAVETFNRVLTDVEMVSGTKALQVYGDSTAAGDATGTTATEKWFYLLRTGYDPDRPVNNSGVGGETTDQMLTRVQADTTHRAWTTIFMDRPNSDAETWIANIKASAALLSTSRWFVMPPIQDSPSGQPDARSATIASIQATLLSDPFFSGHTLASTEQAAYIAAMNDDAKRVGSGDWTHGNATGQSTQSTYIKAFFDAQGW